MQTDTAKLIAALRDALSWTNRDIKGFDDISPNMSMLKARQKLLRAALKGHGMATKKKLRPNTGETAMADMQARAARQTGGTK